MSYCIGFKFFLTTTQQKSVSAQLWGITDYYANQFISLGQELWAQLFEGRLSLNPGLNLTLISFSSFQKHFLG